MFRRDTIEHLPPLSALISLKGKRALITGAASGIGKAIAYRFGEAGATLVLVDINQARLSRVKNQLAKAGIDASIHVVDLAQKAAIDQLWAERLHDAPRALVGQGGVSVLLCAG